MIDGVEEGESIELSPVNNEGGTEQDGSVARLGESINLTTVKQIEISINMDFSQEPTELIKAIDLNVLDGVLNALGSGADPNETSNPLRITPLHFAAWRGLLQIVRLLVEKVADVNAVDCFGRTAVYLAAAMGHTECVIYLAEKGAKLDLATEKVDWDKLPGLTILKNGSMNEKQRKPYMYYLGIEMPLDDRGRMTPLHIAVKENQLECVSAILEAGGMVDAADAEGMQPILHAGTGVKPREEAAIKKYEGVLTALLEKGADATTFYKGTDLIPISTSALRKAAAIGSVEAVNILLKKGANPKWGADCGDGRTALHDAARRGNLLFLEKFLEFEKDKKERRTWVNQQDREGNTSFYMAAYSGSKSCISLLLKEGGNLGVKNNEGVSPMEAIILHVPQSKEFILEILNSKVSCNSFDEDDKELKLLLNFDILMPDGNNKQTEVLNSIVTTRCVNDDICAEIMDHPLVHAFVELKWKRNLMAYSLLVAIYAFLAISHSSLLWFEIGEKGVQRISWIHFAIHFILVLLVLVLLVFNLLSNFRYWICRQEIWTYGIGPITSMTGIIMIVFGDDENRTMDFLSIACVLLWTGLMLVLGQIPYLGTRALIFSDVFRNVIMIILIYIFIVIGFSLFFFLQFHRTHPQFERLLISLETTIAMILSDYQYKEIFSNELKVPPRFICRFMFVVFMIVGSIVLLEVIVCLAVGDRDSMISGGKVHRLYRRIVFLNFLDEIPNFRAREMSEQFHFNPYKVKKMSIHGFKESLPEKLKGELVSLAVMRKAQQTSRVDIVGICHVEPCCAPT